MKREGVCRITRNITKMSVLQSDTPMAEMGNMNGDMMNQDMINAMDMTMDLGPGDSVYNSVEPMSEFKPPENVRNDSAESLDTAKGSTGMSGAGAGPLPTDFGAVSVRDAGSSTLTEFTKRRNWSQRVLEELKDFLYILTPDGRLLYVSPSAKPLTGWEATDLVGKFIVDFIHSDDSSLFIREFNESIATGHPLRFYYRFRKADSTYLIFESHGHPHLTSEAAAFGPSNAAGFCRGFFMMARPYPTKNAELLDSFLEHKIENERLTARIATLRREEAEEAEAQARHYHKKAEGRSDVTPSESFNDAPQTPSATSPSRRNSADNGSMPPPAKPTLSNTALTREALDEANAFSRPDSITDKMMRYEGSSHVDDLERMTGLRYRDGERSHGISTGDSSPALIRGDAGIAIPADHPGRPAGGYSAADKKFSKKLKAADEYVCTDCGTLDSPEWRKGPNGPKTLCNACGLRWAKKEKKRTGKDDGKGSDGEREGTGPGLPVTGLGAGPRLPIVPAATTQGSNGS